MKRAELDALLLTMLDTAPGISDINFSVGRPPQVEAFGVLRSAAMSPPVEKLSPYQTERIALNIIGSERRLARELASKGSCDCAYMVNEKARFRVNIFRQRGHIAIVMRKAQTEVPTIQTLGLAPVFKDVAKEKTGLVLVTGATGSGKTTTLAAVLDEINRNSAVHIVTLEDPVEALVSGVSQSHVTADGPLNYANGLRSLMRQDPEVILVGEVRDPATAVTVFQASLTGHLVLSTLHAGSAARGVARLVDMGIEPYLVRSGLRAILSQRLVRRLCRCARPAADEGQHLGLSVAAAQVAVGCGECRHTGYRGRVVLAEQLPPLEGPLGRGVLDRVDAVELERLALAADMVPLLARGCAAVAAGLTDPAEIRRVLGFDASQL